jgi:hypothetical protein
MSSSVLKPRLQGMRIINSQKQRLHGLLALPVVHKVLESAYVLEKSECEQWRVGMDGHEPRERWLVSLAVPERHR